MSSLLARAATAIVILAITFFSYFLFGLNGLYFLSLILSLFLSYEVARLTLGSVKNFGYLLASHLVFWTYFFFHPEIKNLALVLLAEITLWLWFSGFGNKQAEQIYQEVYKVFPFLFFSLVCPTFVLAHFFMDEALLKFVMLLFVVFSFDSFSYLSGKLLGGKIFRRALFSAASPSKTIEGALFGASLTLVLFSLVFPHFDFQNALLQNPVKRYLLCLSFVVLALTGDLLESLLKRSSKVKDSGSLFPGHGGVFDRLDGVLLTGLLSYIILQ